VKPIAYVLGTWCIALVSCRPRRPSSARRGLTPSSAPRDGHQPTMFRAARRQAKARRPFSAPVMSLTPRRSFDQPPLLDDSWAISVRNGARVRCLPRSEDQYAPSGGAVQAGFLGGACGEQVYESCGAALAGWLHAEMLPLGAAPRRRISAGGPSAALTLVMITRPARWRRTSATSRAEKRHRTRPRHQLEGDRRERRRHATWTAVSNGRVFRTPPRNVARSGDRRRACPGFPAGSGPVSAFGHASEQAILLPAPISVFVPSEYALDTVLALLSLYILSPVALLSAAPVYQKSLFNLASSRLSLP